MYDAMLALAQAEEYRGDEFRRICETIHKEHPSLRSSVAQIREVLQTNSSATPKHATEEAIRRWQRRHGYRFLKRLQAPCAKDRYLAYVDAMIAPDGTACVMKEMPHRERWLLGKTSMYEDVVLERLAHVDNIPRLMEPRIEIEGCDFFVKTWVEGEALSVMSPRIMQTLCKTLAEIHEAGVVVVDLCPRNILTHGKFFDFGCSQVGDVVDTFVIEPIYTAPEIYKTRRATAASDVFALAVMWHRLTYKMHPFVLGTSTDASLRRREIACYGMSHFSGALSRDDVPEIIRRMLRSDPTQRPTARECHDTFCARSLPHGNSP